MLQILNRNSAILGSCSFFSMYISQITCISDSKHDPQVLGFFSSLHKNLFRILHLLETMRIFLIPIRNSEKVSADSYDISKRSSHFYQILDVRFFSHENPLLPIRFIIGVLSFLLDSKQECFCCCPIRVISFLFDLSK